MKKLILLLIALTTFMNVSYASFPISDTLEVQQDIMQTEEIKQYHYSLQKMGVVHKSNQSKTYFVCHGNAKDKHNPALAICKKCEKTEELNPNIFSKLFHNIKTKEKYNFSNFEIEISTICQKCN